MEGKLVYSGAELHGTIHLTGADVFDLVEQAEKKVESLGWSGAWKLLEVGPRRDRPIALGRFAEEQLGTAAALG